MKATLILVRNQQQYSELELLQHLERLTEHSQLSTLSTAWLLLLSQPHYQLANDNSDETVKVLRLARQQLDRSCMLMQVHLALVHLALINSLLRVRSFCRFLSTKKPKRSWISVLAFPRRSSSVLKESTIGKKVDTQNVERIKRIWVLRFLTRWFASL